MSAILDIHDVNVSFRHRQGWFGKSSRIPALKNVSLRIEPGQVVAVVGESGSGKSTLARLVLRLLHAESGEVLIEGKDHRKFSAKDFASAIQPVFQDPYSSLNPKQSISHILQMPLILRNVPAAERAKRTRNMLDLVGMPLRLIDAYPNQLSGGQRQRVAIARALMVRPRLLVCDEPTSALDVSVQAQILQLFAELRQEFNLTYLFISHNLAVVERIADKVAVMYRGEIVETGQGRAFFDAPKHPYSQLLLSCSLPPVPGLPLPDVSRDFEINQPTT